jgi:hypothetical protein
MLSDAIQNLYSMAVQATGVSGNSTTESSRAVQSAPPSSPVRSRRRRGRNEMEEDQAGMTSSHSQQDGLGDERDAIRRRSEPPREVGARYSDSRDARSSDESAMPLPDDAMRE